MTEEQNTGPVAVITGASSGIGAATARALAANGYRLALLARRVDRLEQLAAELGPTAAAIAADVTDRSALVAAADRVHQEFGGADLLVNNAGVMLLGPFSSAQRDEARRMVEVNLLGAMTATEVFLDQLRDGGGDLVNISSVAGRTARAWQRGVRGDEVGYERLVRGVAAGTAARHPGHAHRTRRGGDRADRPHHRPGSQAGRRTALRATGHHRRRRRRSDRVRGDPTSAHDAERDPAATHQPTRMRLPSRLDRPKDTRSLTAEALARASFGVLP